jgi:NCS1 family nucleobase:cation symporter-1
MLTDQTVILGPLMGVFTADYYLVRKQKVKLSDLYLPSPRGIYYFTRGINFRAYVAWILGWVPTIGGMASVDPANSVPQGLVETYYTGFITGYLISFLAHWGLSVVFPPVGLGEVDEYDSVSVFVSYIHLWPVKNEWANGVS